VRTAATGAPLPDHHGARPAQRAYPVVTLLGLSLPALFAAR